MECPHCGIGFYPEEEVSTFCENDDYEIGASVVDITTNFCPECHKPIIDIKLGKISKIYSNGEYDTNPITQKRIYPIWEKETHLSEFIPEKYHELFLESERVNCVSPRASATLSRYLLQMILHEELEIKEKTLEKEISKLEDKTNIPSELIQILQVMRRVANFAAHPKKSTNSNEIVEVAKGESEIMLEVIKQLFDYVFVKPKEQETYLKGIEEKFGISITDKK